MRAKNSIKESRTDWDRLKTMSDATIDSSDIPELDTAFFKEAKLRLPQGKQSVSLRLDRDVLDWFRRQGKGYQTKINAILRAYIQTHHN
ncbi:BrnA antitoxin family protein [Planctomycetota bacterium]